MPPWRPLTSVKEVFGRSWGRLGGNLGYLGSVWMRLGHVLSNLDASENEFWAPQRHLETAMGRFGQFWRRLRSGPGRAGSV